MPNYLNLELHGHLGKAPELFHTATGKTYCRFSVAFNHGKEKKETTWFNCTAWDDVADEIAKLDKGEAIRITNSIITNNKWTDREGNRRDGWQVTVFGIEQAPPQEETKQEEPEDVPF